MSATKTVLPVANNCNDQRLQHFNIEFDIYHMRIHFVRRLQQLTLNISNQTITINSILINYVQNYFFFPKYSKMSASKAKQLFNGISKQYLNAATADVFFLFGDVKSEEKVPAHKLLLIAYSGVFETMFYGSLPEGNAVMIMDASANGFRAFLRYFYFNEYVLDIGSIDEVMYLAQKYNVSEYFDNCWSFLKDKKTAEHILIGYELASKFDCAELKAFFEEQIVIENKLIFASDEIRSIDREVLKHILQIKYFKSCTKKIFDACIAWAEVTCISGNTNLTVLQNLRMNSDQ